MIERKRMRCYFCGDDREITFFVRAVCGDYGKPSDPFKEILVCEACTRRDDVIAGRVAYFYPPLTSSYSLGPA